jgi:hypothetical protein
MHQGLAAVLAACVAGVAGAAGAKTSGKAARQQAAHEHALRTRSAALEAIDGACNAFHQKGLLAVQAAREFEAAVFAGRDGLSEEDVFRGSISDAIAATFEVRWCMPDLEEPARWWCVGIKEVADAVRTLRADPSAASDPTSPAHHRWGASWTQERETLLRFWEKSQKVKNTVSARYIL